MDLEYCDRRGCVFEVRLEEGKNCDKSLKGNSSLALLKNLCRVLKKVKKNCAFREVRGVKWSILGISEILVTLNKLIWTRKSYKIGNNLLSWYSFDSKMKNSWTWEIRITLDNTINRFDQFEDNDRWKELA